MKVVARNGTNLGIGEIFSVKQEPNLHYKVLFPQPPIKIFYPHEITRMRLPINIIVTTKYGTGTITASHDGGDSFHEYDIEFGMNMEGKRTLKETVITRVTKGIHAPSTLETGDVKAMAFFLSAYYFRHVLPTDPRFQAICHGRIEAFPHQLKVITKVLGTYPARFLLADEVGLGKTIEACSVIKELSLRNVVYRAIIIAPANLVEQWKYELLSKFNLDFTVYDGSMIKTLKSGFPGVNPWTIHPRILTSLHFARRDSNREQLKDVFFDISVFDEAHHLRRYRGTSDATYRKTKNYELGESLCTRSRFVLFLTATPMQLDAFELFSLIQLLDPAMFPKYANFTAFKEKVMQYNFLIRDFSKFPRMNVFEKNFMAELVEELLPKTSRFAGSSDAIKRTLMGRVPALKDEITSIVREKHLLSKIMIRNKKKHAFRGFLPKRLTKIVLVQPTKEELEVYHAIRLYITNVYQRSLQEGNNATGFVMVVFQRLLASSHFALRKTVQDRIAKLREVQVKLLSLRANVEQDAATMTEEEFQAKINEIERKTTAVDEDVPLLTDYHAKLVALNHDSKASALVDLIKDISKDESSDMKILLFTQFIRTLNYLKRVIETSMPGIEVGVFHGKLTKDQKDIEVDRFKSASGKPFIMLSTEAGGEGRNFQFCHVIVNYDLPWNPMKLEQRIGRVDRIGQNKDVKIYNFALKDTVEENIVRILSERIFAFQEIVGELEPILVDFEQDIEHAILSSRNDDELDLRFEMIGSKVSTQLKNVQDHRAAMQDVVMEMESKDVLDDPVYACNIELNYDRLLQAFVLEVINELQQPGAGATGGLASAMKKRARGLGTGGVTRYPNNTLSIKDATGKERVGTFDRAAALRNERLDFFNLGHPIVEKSIDAALAIDTSRIIGTFKEEIHALLESTGGIDGMNLATLQGCTGVAVVCNAMEMTGVKSQRRLVCQAFSLRNNQNQTIVEYLGVFPEVRFLEHVMDNLATFHARDPLPRQEPVDMATVLDLNSRCMQDLANSMQQEWVAQNDKVFAEMKAKEEHYLSVKLRKHKDEITQATFYIAEKMASEDEGERKSVNNLEKRIQHLEEQVEREKQEFQEIMKDIEESYKRSGLVFVPLGIFLIKNNP